MTSPRMTEPGKESLVKYGQLDLGQNMDSIPGWPFVYEQPLKNTWVSPKKYLGLSQGFWYIT